MPYVYTPLPGARRTAVRSELKRLSKIFRSKHSSVEDDDGPTQLPTRLLTIHPGEYEDSIKVDLDIVDLDPEAASYPEYDALSYVWGSEEKPCTVSVGRDGESIPITENLDQALRYLRYSDRPRTMWIDALCIDQGSTAERGRQVSYMSHIYWKAPRVVVWLGPSADDSDHAMEALQYLGRQYRRGPVEHTRRGVTNLDRRTEESGPPYPLGDRQIVAIWAFINRPWFERVWVRQEVMQAYNESSVQCGRMAIGFEDLREALFFYSKYTAPRRELVEKWDDKMWLIERLFEVGGYDFRALRYQTLGTLCTDPRDYIYAFLGMLSRTSKPLAIVPDYSESNTASRLFQDIAQRVLKQTHRLALLESCGWDYLATTPSKHNIAIPTWVPNWALPKRMPYALQISGLFAPVTSDAIYLGNGVLRAAGVSFGTIQDMFKLDASTDEALAASIRTLVPPNAVTTRYPGGAGCNLWNAFRITFCANAFRDFKAPPYYRDSPWASRSVTIQESKEAMRRIMSAEDLPANNNFLKLVREWVEMGQFFKTDEDYLGWGPKTIGKGDQVVYLPGCDLPLVIRRSPGSKEQHFEVLGPCFLHGTMFAEHFLGPFPYGIHPVEHLVDGSPIYRFYNTRTGETTVLDPRLKALPFDFTCYESGIRENVFRPFGVTHHMRRMIVDETKRFDLI